MNKKSTFNFEVDGEGHKFENIGNTHNLKIAVGGLALLAVLVAVIWYATTPGGQALVQSIVNIAEETFLPVTNAINLYGINKL